MTGSYCSERWNGAVRNRPLSTRAPLTGWRHPRIRRGSCMSCMKSSEASTQLPTPCGRFVMSPKSRVRLVITHAIVGERDPSLRSGTASRATIQRWGDCGWVCARLQLN